MIKYKLTDQNLQTYNDFQWKIGETKTTSGTGELCSSGWLHYYDSPLLAILLNPIHANIKNPRLFECEIGEITKDDKGLKGGSTQLTLIKEIDIPIISVNQKVAFAILCAKKVCKDSIWNLWADNWLNNINKSRTATIHAINAVNAAYATAATAANAAAYAAYAAAAAYAAYAGADAAAYAATITNFNLQSIAEECLKYS